MPNPKSAIELIRMMFKLNPELKLGWGSNLLGQGVGKAGAGQAEFAGELGAIYGQGRGAAGRTFAIPTKTAPYGRARTIHEIKPEIQAFGEHVKASDNPWFLAAIGTGRGRGMKSVDQASKDIATLVRDQGLFELENLAVSKKLLNSIHQPQNPLGIKLYESIAGKNWHAPKQVVNREAIETAIQAKTKKKIYHGTRSNNPESFIDAEGNLVLKASENFSGKQVGVSFSEDIAVSKDYASRVAGQGPVRNPTQGAVFEIERDAVTNKLFMESAEEIATRGSGTVVIPKGKFKIIKDSKKQSVDNQLKAWEQKEIATESKYAKARSNKELGVEEEKRIIDEYSVMDDGGEINYHIADDDYVSMAITDKWGTRSPGFFENTKEITRRISTSKDPEKTALEILQGAGVENLKNPHPVYAELINEIMTGIGPQLTQKLGLKTL